MGNQQSPSGPVFGPTQQTTVVGVPGREKPSGLAIFIGIVTMLVSIGLGIASLAGGVALLGYAVDEGAVIGSALSCIPIGLAVYGLISGAILTFSASSAGKILTTIFWIMLIGGACILVVFGALLFGAVGY